MSNTHTHQHEYLDLGLIERQHDLLDQFLARTGCPLRLRDRIQDAEAAIAWARTYIKANGA